MHLNEWENSTAEDVFYEFDGVRWGRPVKKNKLALLAEKPAFKNVKILLASYSKSDYEGCAFVLFERDGKLWEVNASHCSCYGLEGQWDPEETTPEALRYRIEQGNFGKGCHGAHGFATELLQILAELDSGITVPTQSRFDMTPNETDEKAPEVTPSQLDVLGVQIVSRYGVLSELSAMLQFCQVLSDYDAFAYIEALSYDSKAGICTIYTHEDTPRGERIEEMIATVAAMTLPLYSLFGEIENGPRFQIGQFVRKRQGAQWSGRVCGFYYTSLTYHGYCVESDAHRGSVQIYPEFMLEGIEGIEGIEDPANPPLH